MIPTKEQSALADDRRRKITSACDVQPMSRAEIAAMLGVPTVRSVDHYTGRLSELGVIVARQSGRSSVWMTPRLRAHLYPAESSSAPTIATTLPELPRPVLTTENGVPVTRQAAPRGRYEVDLPPGGGVISQDWAARRGARA